MLIEDLRKLSWHPVEDYERDLTARYFGDYIVSSNVRCTVGAYYNSASIVTLVYKSDIENYITSKASSIAKKCNISCDEVQRVIFAKNVDFFVNFQRVFKDANVGYQKDGQTVKQLMRGLSLPDLSVIDCLEMFKKMTDLEKELFMKELNK